VNQPAKPTKIPKYSLHASSGQARVVVNGKHIYLGKYGSAESHKKYSQIIAELASGSLASLSDLPSGQFDDLSIDELLLRYLQFARSYYSENGKPSKEYRCMMDAVKHLRPRFGDSFANEFGPRKLAIVREDMISQGLARTLINNRINRIRRVFKWAVSMELIPPGVFQAICTLEGLKYGRSNARESKPVQAVADDQIERVAAIASPQIRAMILLQRYTGMRPGEVVVMRPCDIDRSQSPWIYEPFEHKNKYRGHRREVPLGPKSQELLTPFLNREATAYLFSPQEAELWRNEQRRQSRKSKITPSQASRKPKSRPKRAKRDGYDVDSYRRAIRYCQMKLRREQQLLPADQRVEIELWHPHQLRHQFATVVRRELGAEAVQVGLGHKSTNLVDLYAEKDRAAALSIARKLG
jgi:integrase